MAPVVSALPRHELLARVEALHRSGLNHEVLEQLGRCDLSNFDDATQSELFLAKGAALYDVDDVTGSIEAFRSALDRARGVSTRLQFSAAFSLFTREAELQTPEETIPVLSELRQLAASLGNSDALASLHLVVAGRQGMRGNFIDARRHVELARKLADQGAGLSTLCALYTVESSLEIVSGNLARAQLVAERGFTKALSENYARYVVGCATNLSAIAIWTGKISSAREYIAHVLKLAQSSRMRFCALDNLLQIALYEGDLGRAKELIEECTGLQRRLRAPRPSWYELSHQSTRCHYFELLAEWDQVLLAAKQIDEELSRRQLRALHTVVLCARARALSQTGDHEGADSSLILAQRACPHGAVQALIILEASKGLCLLNQGEDGPATKHLDRALATCRAIGDKYHEWWLSSCRARVQRAFPSAARPSRDFDATGAAFLLGDATTILGAGHSIDLLAQRAAAILESAFPKGRAEIQSESGKEYQSEFSARWEQAVDGTFRIRIRGSDRSVTVQVRGVQSLDEVSIVKSVADLVRMAVHRTTEADTNEEEQILWPRSLVPGSDDAVFQSPRMIELLRIATRLASTDLPILLGGETGTGKEVFARLIHEHSRVKHGPFVAYNCSAMPRDLVESQLFGHRRGAFTGATDSFPGLIRSAERGTLFLDEIGDLDQAIQPKLLRFLEGAEIHPIGELRPQKVGVRIVAATNANLDGLVEEGRFRRDLFYRLGVARLSLPPLRERKDEIPALASLFLGRFSRECHRTGVRLADDLIAALLLYDWPGNLRQLANEIRRVVAMADDGQTLHSTDLAPDITAAWNSRPTTPIAEASTRTVAIGLDQPLDQAVEELERIFVDRAMESAGGRVAEAAQVLSISRKGLFLKRRRWGLVDHERS